MAELEELVERLSQELEKGRCTLKRPAAPLSRGEPKGDPKRPGRPVGHPAAHRERPARVDRVVPVPLGRTACPTGAGQLIPPTAPSQY